MARSLTRVVLLTGLCLLAACRKPAPEAPPAVAPGAAATIEVLKDGRWLFTYADPFWRLRHHGQARRAPAGVRAVVRVFDPLRARDNPR